MEDLRDSQKKKSCFILIMSQFVEKKNNYSSLINIQNFFFNWILLRNFIKKWRERIISYCLCEFLTHRVDFYCKNILYHSVHLLCRNSWARLLSEDTHAFNSLRDCCCCPFKCTHESYTRSLIFFIFYSHKWESIEKQSLLQCHHRPFIPLLTELSK